MKAQIRRVDDHGVHYEALTFVCPGCVAMVSGTGLHLLPVNCAGIKDPSWTWDGNLYRPTVTPSILTKYGTEKELICHSFLRGGVFEFLSDCTHSLVGKHVDMPDLPDWAIKENNGD